MQKLLSILLLCATMLGAHAQQFVLPGINQKAADLSLMKQQVQKGIQPYKEMVTPTCNKRSAQINIL